MLPGRAPNEPQWNRYANQLHDSAVAAMKAAQRQDKDALFRTGGDIYAACTSCHKRYVLGER
jgi:cytochrome c556